MTVDWRKARNWGFYAGASLVFIAAIGMVEAFDRRPLITPGVSLGLASLLWVPPLFAFIATRRQQLEGFETGKAGVSEVGAGALVGLLSGSMLWLFTALVDATFQTDFNIRDIFPKLGPAMVRLLTFE